MVEVVRVVKFATGSCPCPYGGFGNGIFVTPAGDVISLQTANTVRHLAFKDDPRQGRVIAKREVAQNGSFDLTIIGPGRGC